MSDNGLTAGMQSTLVSYVDYCGIYGHRSGDVYILIYQKNGWSKIHESEWKIAQFLTPIVGLVTLGLASHGNYISLFTVILGF